MDDIDEDDVDEALDTFGSLTPLNSFRRSNLHYETDAGASSDSIPGGEDQSVVSRNNSIDSSPFLNSMRL